MGSNSTSLYSIVAEFGLLDPHTVSREGWVLESRELRLRQDMQIFKGREQPKIVGPSDVGVEPVSPRDCQRTRAQTDSSVEHLLALTECPR